MKRVIIECRTKEYSDKELKLIQRVSNKAKKHKGKVSAISIRDGKISSYDDEGREHWLPHTYHLLGSNLLKTLVNYNNLGNFDFTAMSNGLIYE